MTRTSTPNCWIQSRADVFWSEIAATDHVLQIYNDDTVLMDVLSGFVGSGINAGDCMVVIATPEHQEALENRLRSYGIYIDFLISDHRYIPVNAGQLLDEFMRQGMPQRELFFRSLMPYLSKALRHKRKLRAFGEMVSLLWQRGEAKAAVKLEQLWNELRQADPFSLFCAYPGSAFPEEGANQQISSGHSYMINGLRNQLTEVFYKRPC